MPGPDDTPERARSAETTGEPPDGPHTVLHDWNTGDPLYLTVVFGVAAVTETEPGQLPPLYDAIDPENLERLIQEAPDESLTVSFPYADCAVRVTGGGEVTIQSSTTE